MPRPAPACVPRESRCTVAGETGRQTTTSVRYVAFFHGRIDTDGPTYTARRQARLDAPAEREAYGRRSAKAASVFGNLRANKRLNRFMRRGRAKVNGQWTLYCLVHDIEKLAHAGFAA